MGFALSDMQLASSSFVSGGAIAARHSKSGGNVSPQLHWDAAPQDTKSFVVFCHDPDAPLFSPAGYGFVHWLLYNIPGTTSELEENTSTGAAGRNDFGDIGWGGPQPPEGHGKHHYFFWLLALDKDIQLESGLDLRDLLSKIEPHIIGANRMVGTFESP